MESGADRVVDRLCSLVATPSVTGTEQAAIDLVAEWLVADGADEVDAWVDSMANLENDPAYPGREVEREEVPVVAARIAGSRPGPCLLLTGHVDTVAVGEPDRWSHRPMGEPPSGDRVYGRGACDMKAGMVAAIEAFRTLAQSDRDFRGEVRLVAVSGEEDGGSGTLAAIRRGWTADMVVVTEPTSGPEGLSIVVAHGGALTFTIDVTGRSAHGSMPAEGESALDHFLTVYRAMRDLETELNERESNEFMRALPLPYATNVGIVRGGTWASNVMDRLTAEVRVGVAVGETAGEAERRFTRTLQDAVAGDPFLAAHPPQIRRTGAAFGSAFTPPEHPLVATVARASREATGRDPELRGAPYGCDMALWATAGGATAIVYGPGDVRNAHAADEWVSITETRTVATVLEQTALLLLRREADVV